VKFKRIHGCGPNDSPRFVIDGIGEGLKLVLQVTGPSAGKPANHPNRKGVITATSATRLAPRGPWRLGEAHQYANTSISPSADVTVDIKLNGVRPVHSDAALTLKLDPTPYNRHDERLDPGVLQGGLSPQAHAGRTDEQGVVKKR